MIDNLTVRRYKSSDHDAVWNLHILALNSIEQSRHIAGPWDDDLHAIEDIYLNLGGEFLVAEIAGVLVAMGALRRLSQTRAEIKRMRVHPDYWRQGIAQHLLSRLEMLAQEKGYQILELDTTIQQEAAQKLYVKNGYQETRRGKVGPFDFIFYEKSL
ncbi:MAG: GNAT family N-acetyltransferase [Caldilineaceae bacterium]